MSVQTSRRAANPWHVALTQLDAVGKLPAILQALSGAGFQPGAMHVRENTLEDVFIQLTGRRLRE